MPLALNQICRFVLVDLRHAAHDPFALRDLVLHATCGAVVEIQVVPAVALRHPDDFLALVVDVVAELAPAVEERLRLLGDDRARGACRRVNLDQPDGLMSSLRVLERHRPAVLAPCEP